MNILPHEKLLNRHVVELSERIRKRCLKEGKDTFTIKMLKEEKCKMYEGNGIVHYGIVH